MAINDLKAYYKGLYSEHGTSHHAVQMSSKESQLARYSSLVRHIPTNESILDVGCGFGGMSDYLFNEKGHTAKYKGVDLVEEFISNGLNRENPLVEYEVIDATTGQLPIGYDWPIACGIFNNIVDDNWKFLTDVVKQMIRVANKGIAVNMLSTYVDYQAKDLAYYNPVEVFDFFKKELSPLVILDNSYRIKQDTIPYEFTILAMKEN